MVCNITVLDTIMFYQIKFLIIALKQQVRNPSSLDIFYTSVAVAPAIIISASYEERRVHTEYLFTSLRVPKMRFRFIRP